MAWVADPANGAMPGEVAAATDPAQALPVPGPRVLGVDDDRLLYGLIEEWLAASGCQVTSARDTTAPASARYDVIVVDVPFPRQGGATVLHRLAEAHPATPILALSSTFFDGIGSHGTVARTLGVAGVLPKPLRRETLLAAVRGVLRKPS